MDISPLKDDFIVAPFSVLDTRTKDWKARKDLWRRLGVCESNGRDSGMTFKINNIAWDSVFGSKDMSVMNKIDFKLFCLTFHYFKSS